MGIEVVENGSALWFTMFFLAFLSLFYAWLTLIVWSTPKTDWSFFKALILIVSVIVATIVVTTPFWILVAAQANITATNACGL